tara:strand:- start:225475 stop:227418 length:1944 start_codon:yes stop_codon:yes gene_type:complete
MNTLAVAQVSQMDTLMGMLAVVQMAWLPGYIATRAIRFPSGLMRIFVGFAFSLWWNLILVMTLAATGTLGRTGVLSAIALELVVLIALCVYQSKRKRSEQVTGVVDAEPMSSDDTTKRAAAFAFFCVLVVFGIWMMAIGDTFMRWDAVASWNRWATEWAFSGKPKSMRDYPQLVPATWSVSYMMIGHANLQQFARSIQGMFPLMIMGGLFCAGLANKSRLLFRAVPITFVLIWLLYKPFFVSGYMDIPVAALTTLSWCLILQAKSMNDRGSIIRTVLAGAFVAGIAGACKQAGLVMIVSFPVLVLMLIPSQHGVKRVRLALVSLAVLIGVLLSWYGYSGYQLFSGKETFIGAELVGNFHPRPSMGGRLITAFEKLTPPLTIGRGVDGAIIVWVVLLTSLLGVFHKGSRAVVIAVGIPSWFIWAFGFSYSTRNMAVAVPAMGVGMAGFLTLVLDFVMTPRYESMRERVVNFTKRNARSERSNSFGGFKPLLVAVVVTAGAGLFGYLLIDSEKIAQEQFDQQSKLGEAPINQMLYDADGDNQRLGQIASSYAILRFIPGFADRVHFLPPVSYAAFENQWKNPKVDSFLVRDINHIADDKRIIQQVQILIENGQLIEAGHYGGWTIAVRSYDAETTAPLPLEPLPEPVKP